MKSEHRHELAENDLGKLISRWRDRIEPHANKILVGLLVFTVVVVGAIVAVRSLGAGNSAGAAQLAAATSAAEYEAVANDYEGTLVGHWGRLRAGEEYLREGIRLSLSNRSASNESLENAQRSFEIVLNSDGVPPEVREKALYGLGMTLESLSSAQTGTQAAIDAYQRLIDEFPESRYRRFADQRIGALQQEDVREFYAWFHSQNPRPEDRPLPRDFPLDQFESGRGPQLESRGPAEMPADSANDNPATPDASTPESTAPPENPPAEDTSAEPPAPPSSERQSSDVPQSPQPTAEESATDAGPALPATPQSTAEPPGDAAEPKPDESNP